MDDRTDIQKTETKLSIALFLFRDREWYKNANLVYAHRTLAVKCGGVLSESKKAFSTIAALIRIHLISHLDLIWVITEGRRAYTKRKKSRNKSPANVQMSLF